MKELFYEWIIRERKRSNHFYKLSIDIKGDANAPKTADSLNEWSDYLKLKKVPQKTISFLEEAWAIYWDQERREPYHNY